MLGSRIEIIERPRLLAALDSCPSVTVLRAPAGYGKSVLLDQWQATLTAAGAQCVRINLSPSLATNESLFPDLGKKLGAEPGADEARILELLAGTGRVHLIIDGVDGLRADERWPTLRFLLRERLPNLSVALASRGRINIPLAKFQAAGEVLELGAADLRFDAEEQQLVVERNCGAKPGGERLLEFSKRFAGWPSGLGFYFQTLPSGGFTRDKAMVVTGAAPIIRAYFEEEGFSQLPEELRRFLIDASIVEVLTAETCDQVRNRSDSRRLLDLAHDLGVHIRPLDFEHRAFSFLPIFAEFLRSRLDPERAIELQGRACSLFEAQEEFGFASAQALELGDQPRAAQCLEKQIWADFARRDETRHIALAQRLSPEIVSRQPMTLLVLAQAAIFDFRLEQASGYLEQARSLIAERSAAPKGFEAGPPDGTGMLKMLLVHREMLLALGQHDMARAQELGDRLMADMSVIPPMQRVMILNSLTHAQLELYIFRGAERFYVQGKALIPQLESWISSVPLETFHARYLFLTGRTRAAIDLLERVLKELTDELGPRPRLGAIAGIALAEMKLEIGEVDEARRLVSAYGEHLEGFGFVSLMLAGRITQSRLHFIAQEYEEGFALLDRIPTSAGELYDRVSRAQAVERLVWSVRLGRDHEARQICASIGLSLSRLPEARSGAATYEEAFAFAWVQLARSQNQLDDAIHVARSWLRYTEGVGAVKSHVRWNVMAASLLVLNGDRTHAMRLLRRAVALGAVGSYRQTVLFEIGVLANQLRTLLDGDLGSAETEFIRDLLGAETNRNAAGEMSERGMPQRLFGAFNARESTVMRLVARGMINREIGDSLGMTEGTVKWHLHRIYDKLGIRRRSQLATLIAQWNSAVAAPRPLGDRRPGAD